jgi:hypothetical protein
MGELGLKGYLYKNLRLFLLGFIKIQKGDVIGKNNTGAVVEYAINVCHK